MWTNIWDFLKAFITYSERMTRLEKQIEKIEQKQNDTTTTLTAVIISLERMAEREKWREEKLRHEIELERAKSEADRAKYGIEQAHSETARAKAEIERLKTELERRSLPPSSGETKDDQS